MGNGIFGPMFDTVDDADALVDAYHDEMEAHLSGGGPVDVAKRVEANRRKRARRRSPLLIERVFSEWDDTKAFLRERVAGLFQKPVELVPFHGAELLGDEEPKAGIRGRLSRMAAKVEARIVDKIAERVVARAPADPMWQFDELFGARTRGVLDEVVLPAGRGAMRGPEDLPGRAANDDQSQFVMIAGPDGRPLHDPPRWSAVNVRTGAPLPENEQPVFPVGGKPLGWAN